MKFLRDNTKVGPNTWADITKDDFGKEFDYKILRLGAKTVIDPFSKAARQWLYAHMPDDAPRYQVLGYTVETERVHEVLKAMAAANLVSEEEYEFNCNAEDRDRHAGENQ